MLGKVLDRAEIGGRKVRALRPWADPDVSLLRAIARGEFVTNGFRNRDLVPHLHGSAPEAAHDRRKLTAKLSRHLRLLRAHHVIEKIQGTHRYRVTRNGRTLLTAVIATLDASISQLKQCA